MHKMPRSGIPQALSNVAGLPDSIAAVVGLWRGLLKAGTHARGVGERGESKG